MFRFVLFISLAVLVVLFAITLHVNAFIALLFLALGGLLTSASENQVGYNFIDWLKDRLLALFGWFQSYSHAKIATLKARAAKIAGKIEAEQQKIDVAIRRRL
jgi:hypothetical protein